MTQRTVSIAIFIGIFMLAAVLRFFDNNWDQGFHLHPDERAIVLYTTQLSLPQSFASFVSVTSPWNPHFFAYGSFPLYLLKIVGFLFSVISPLYAQYDLINILGRILSTVFDLGTLVLIFLFGKKIGNAKIGLLASFFYAVSVLPIQLSHFYAVDTLLTFFIFLTLYQLIRFYETPTTIKAVFIGIAFGFALATKISAIVLIAPIGIALLADFFLLVLKNPHRPHTWFPHLPKFLVTLIRRAILMSLITYITFILLEPYSLIDLREFWLQTQQQSAMTKDAFTFPYTLQYVGKIPYLYEVQNIFLWGEGPFLALLTVLGTIFFTSLSFQKHHHKKWAKDIILVVFFWVYFFVVGKFAIGFMRYMLPLYPLFSLFAAVFMYTLALKIKQFISFKLVALCSLLFTLCLLFWPLSFMHIYTKPNTRVLASNWINSSIPYGSTIAIEHWDDGLPLFGQNNYRVLTLTLYDPDTPQKWNVIRQQLAQTDYIIIASNRLYVPLQKLTDCVHLPLFRCYQQTASYYTKLFNGQLGFTKVAEFSISPQLPLINYPINDQSADESFTVYDHPKVMIFKKEQHINYQTIP